MQLTGPMPLTFWKQSFLKGHQTLNRTHSEIKLMIWGTYVAIVSVVVKKNWEDVALYMVVQSENFEMRAVALCT